MELEYIPEESKFRQWCSAGGNINLDLLKALCPENVFHGCMSCFVITSRAEELETAHYIKQLGLCDPNTLTATQFHSGQKPTTGHLVPRIVHKEV